MVAGVLNIMHNIEQEIRDGCSTKYSVLYRARSLGAGMVAVLNIVYYIEQESRDGCSTKYSALYRAGEQGWLQY